MITIRKAEERGHANYGWLDLCAGNGSMGAEALCRGASLVIGIEQSGRAGEIIIIFYLALFLYGSVSHLKSRRDDR